MVWDGETVLPAGSTDQYDMGIAESANLPESILVLLFIGYRWLGFTGQDTSHRRDLDSSQSAGGAAREYYWIRKDWGRGLGVSPAPKQRHCHVQRYREEFLHDVALHAFPVDVLSHLEEVPTLKPCLHLKSVLAREPLAVPHLYQCVRFCCRPTLTREAQESLHQDETPRRSREPMGINSPCFKIQNDISVPSRAKTRACPRGTSSSVASRVRLRTSPALRLGDSLSVSTNPPGRARFRQSAMPLRCAKPLFRGMSPPIRCCWPSHQGASRQGLTACETSPAGVALHLKQRGTWLDNEAAAVVVRDKRRLGVVKSMPVAWIECVDRLDATLDCRRRTNSPRVNLHSISREAGG